MTERERRTKETPTISTLVRVDSLFLLGNRSDLDLVVDWEELEDGLVPNWERKLRRGWVKRE